MKLNYVSFWKHIKVTVLIAWNNFLSIFRCTVQHTSADSMQNISYLKENQKWSKKHKNVNIDIACHNHFLSKIALSNILVEGKLILENSKKGIVSNIIDVTVIVSDGVNLLI